jgi:hypothetical protein
VRAAAAKVDWERLLPVAARHRVEGLVWDGLTRAGVEAPDAVARPLAAVASLTARENLQFAAEAARLGRAFDAAGLPFLVLKGVTLNMLAYGTLALKRSADVDVSVEPSRYADAVRLMAETGYACVGPAPGASVEDLLAGLSRNKHSIWERGAIWVELHAALVDSPLLLPGISAASERQAVPIAPGLSLPTLAREPLFAYLCVHGASHGWSRLKWLADVAALLKDETPEGVEDLYRRSVTLGAGRSAAQALILCADLLGLALPPALERELRASRANRLLVRAAMRSMLSGGGEVELDRLALGTLPIHFSHFLLLPGWRYKAAELKRKLAGPADTAPGLLAAPRWLLRRLRRARAA